MIKLKRLIQSPDTVWVDNTSYPYNSQKPPKFVFQYVNGKVHGVWGEHSHGYYGLRPEGRLFKTLDFPILSLWSPLDNKSGVLDIANQIKQQYPKLPDLSQWYLDVDYGVTTNWHIVYSIVKQFKFKQGFDIYNWLRLTSFKIKNFFKENKYYYGDTGQFIVPLINYKQHLRNIITYIYDLYKNGEE